MNTFGYRAVAASLAVTLAMAIPAFAQDAKQAPKAKAVGMDTVRVEPLRQTVPVIGRFVPHQAGIVAARVAGPVDKYQVEVGDRVKAGDVLAVLVDNAFVWERNRRKADVASARASLDTARASLQLLDQELKRLEGLKESPAFSPARLNDKRQETIRAKSQIGEATADLKSAEADLELGEIALGNTKIRAPYDGIIVERHSEAGAYLRDGDPVVTILDDNNMEIEADVPANRIAGLTEGRELEARIEDGTPVKAIVRAVIPDENPRTRTRRVRFVSEFEGDARSTAANQSVTVHVPAGETRNVLTVHKDAVLNRGGAQLVVLNEDGKAAFTPVRLGEAIGQRFVVQNGLKEGDEVVIRGNERLQPGEAIKRSNPEAKENAS
ncbi:MAG: efflux RND transporter periplasmic adaptor subunit [Rhodospirillales bacterium]|nr:efflux RND transporter periplasmic adaptor subunit [Rhodospirillales bacterium]